MNFREKTAIAEKFLRELGRGISPEERVMAGYAEEATVRTDANGKKLNAGWWPVPWREGRTIHTGENCYVCISSSIKTPNPKTGEMRYWRGEASFGHGMALMVDDIGNGKGSKGELSIEYFSEILPPTVVVETSPGNHQLWYFFDQPVDDLKLFKAFLLGFVSQVLDKGGDSTIRDISRYGRMPVGINNKRGSNNAFKYADDDGKPFQVRIVEADYTRRHSMQEIARAFQFTYAIPVERRLTEEDRLLLDEDKRLDAYFFRKAERILEAAKQGEGSSGSLSMNMSGKYRIACPWGSEHTNGDRYGAYFRASIPGAEYEYVFGCGHDTCRKENRRTWSSFVDKVVMPYIYAQVERQNASCVGVEFDEINQWTGR